MSNIGYIKKLRSQRAKELKKNHTPAFLVLDTIAENAKFQEDQSNEDLDFGEAIITAESCGVTKNEFHTALKFLENSNDIRVIHRGRKDGNSEFMTRIKPESKPTSIRIKTRIKTRINGTIAKLLSSDIYEVNFLIHQNQNQNQFQTQTRINTMVRPAQTRNKEDKNTKKQQQQKEPAAPVAIFYDCLKENKNLTDEEKKSLMAFDEKRVIASLAYATTVKIKTSLIATLIWHCSQPEIIAPKTKKTDIRKEVRKRFHNNSKTNGVECFHMGSKIRFQRGITGYDLDDKEVDYEEKLNKILETFNIKGDII